MAPMYRLPTTVPVVMQPVMPLVPKMVNGVPDATMSLGASLRDRAFRCNFRSLRSLQFPLQSLAPPFASLTARSACHGGSLRSPPLPDRHAPAEVRRRRPGDRRVLLATGATRRARRRARLGRPGRLRRLRATPRLRVAALRASPVLASPSTGSRTTRRIAAPARARAPAERTRTSLRTAPGSRVRTSADSSASAFGSVLRTTACGSARTARHSFAVAAPLRRLRRRRFPLRSSPDSWLSRRPSAVGSHT